MNNLTLASLGIKLPPLGLGCLQLGGYGWGSISEERLVDAVRRALDLGITLFDTAPIYGLGQSEELLGKTLGSKRKDVVIATKVGLVWHKGEAFSKTVDNSPSNIMREIDRSLKNLGTDYIDIYQIHWPDPSTDIADTLAAMEKLRESGKIRVIGCCNFSLELLEEALKYSMISTIQTPFNLIERTSERDLLPFCQENLIGVLAYSPIARGLLGGKYDERSTFGQDDHRGRSTDGYFAGDAFRENLKVVKRVERVAERLHMTPAQVALRWVLENPGVTTAIFGAKTVAQVEENVASLGSALSPKDMEYLCATREEGT